MLRYDLEQVGITSDYYIIDNFKEERIVSLVNGYEFAKPIVDLLNRNEINAFRDLDSLDKKKVSSMNLLNFRNFLLGILNDYSDDELKDKNVFIKSNNGFYHDFKALQYEDGDFYITFYTIPSFYDSEEYDALMDYSSYLSNYMSYDDMSPEAFMIGEAYDSLKSDSDFVELLDVDGFVLGRFSLHDSLVIMDSSVVIHKDYDVNCNQGYGFSYIVDLKDVYSLSF